ncbi:agamous-like MADS-box protein AGL62 [Chenopodium quinoa]|uniref:MADS-box domain-containing protein n=1 Tax=Chenopodium quinoa TaxID=63459 RepID=A0A803KNF4_CHEQI|nr:agamous-like MADS-box protein AGL62 [Chenopodium quinoa]
MEEYLDDLRIEDQTLNFPEDFIVEPIVMKKKTGKQKIEIKPIINKTSKQVTFTKRRGGLFKKASELCSLCGSEVAVITFSGAGKLFSFGHPNADAVVSRYINYTRGVENNDNNIINGGNGNEFGTGVLSEQYKRVLTNIEVEKKRSDHVIGSSSSSNGSSPRGDSSEFGFWWDKPIDNLGLSELEQLKVSLEGLRDQVSSRVNSINNNNNCSSNSTNQEVVDQKEIVYPSSLLPVNDFSNCF